MAWFRKSSNRRKSRVFLGTLAVVPRTDWKKVDEWGLFSKQDLDETIRRRLLQLFELAPATDVTEPTEFDLVLDVMVPNYQSGDSWTVDLGDIGFPLFWRPKVQVKSRLSFLRSGKTKAVFSVTEKMGIRDYVSRLFTFRAMMRFKPVFDESDIEELLDTACLNILDEMRASI